MKSILVCLLALVSGSVMAQDLTCFTITTTEKPTLSWWQPGSCTDGKPISECPVTGYLVERNTGSGWQVVSGPNEVDAAALPPTERHWQDTPRVAGRVEYRVQVLASSSYIKAPPSNTICFTVEAPAPVLQAGPQPPKLDVNTTYYDKTRAQ